MTTNYTKIIRYDDSGFTVKPYKSYEINYYPHDFPFIPNEVTDIKKTNQKVLDSEIYYLQANDYNWSGCFCHLREYDPKLYSKNGALAMRQKDKKNVAYLPNDTVIWVRNLADTHQNYYYKKIEEQIFHEGEWHNFWSPKHLSFLEYLWVPMTVSLALERIDLWKKNNENLPERITEFYLKEEQLPLLIKPNIYECVLLFLYNKKRKISNI